MKEDKPSKGELLAPLLLERNHDFAAHIASAIAALPTEEAEPARGNAFTVLVQASTNRCLQAPQIRPLAKLVMRLWPESEEEQSQLLTVALNLFGTDGLSVEAVELLQKLSLPQRQESDRKLFKAQAADALYAWASYMLPKPPRETMVSFVTILGEVATADEIADVAGKVIDKERERITTEGPHIFRELAQQAEEQVLAVLRRKLEERTKFEHPDVLLKTVVLLREQAKSLEDLLVKKSKELASISWAQALLAIGAKSDEAKEQLIVLFEDCVKWLCDHWDIPRTTNALELLKILERMDLLGHDRVQAAMRTALEHEEKKPRRRKLYLFIEKNLHHD